MDERNDEPINPPAIIAGRSYNNFKTYMGLTTIPTFPLGESVQPVFDLSTNVNPSTELEFNTVATLIETLAASPWPSRTTQTDLFCPEGQEHLYLYLSAVYDSDAAGLTVDSKFAIFASNQNASFAAGAPTYPNIDPASAPFTIPIFQQSTDIERLVLNGDTLPIYIPPKGILTILPYDITAGAFTGTNYYYVQYVRVKRLAGLGPLVK